MVKSVISGTGGAGGIIAFAAIIMTERQAWEREN